MTTLQAPNLVDLRERPIPQQMVAENVRSETSRWSSPFLVDTGGEKAPAFCHYQPNRVVLKFLRVYRFSAHF